MPTYVLICDSAGFIHGIVHSVGGFHRHTIEN